MGLPVFPGKEKLEDRQLKGCLAQKGWHTDNFVLIFLHSGFAVLQRWGNGAGVSAWHFKATSWKKRKMWGCTAPHAGEYVHYAQCCRRHSSPSQCNSRVGSLFFCGEILKSDCWCQKSKCSSALCFMNLTETHCASAQADILQSSFE